MDFEQSSKPLIAGVMFYKTLSIGFIISLITAYYFKASFGSSVVIIGLSLYLGLPILLIAFFIYLLSKQPIEKNYLLKLSFNISLLIFIFSFNHQVVGSYFNKRHIKSLQLKSENIIKQCHQYFIENESFPENIETGSENVNYWSNGKEFSLEIYDKSTIFGGLVYNSHTKKWGSLD